MKKSLSFIVVLVVAFGLGGCAKKYQRFDPPSKVAVYDNSKSYAWNVLHATSTKPFASMDTPGGGVVKPHKNMKDKDMKKTLHAEALSLDAELSPHTEAALDVGIGAAYNSLITPGWGSAGVTSGGLSNLDSAGVAAGLILLKGLTKNPYEGITEDHYVLFFGWVPQENMSKEEVNEWFRKSLFSAYSKAAENAKTPEPYRLGPVRSDKQIDDVYLPAYLDVTGGWCDVDNVECVMNIGKTIDIHDTIAPEYVGGSESWLLGAGSSKGVHVGRGEKPEGFEAPKFETLSFYEEVGRHLPDEIFMLIPGKNPFKEILYRAEDGSLQPVMRPLLVNRGKTHFFVTPPEVTAQLKKEAGKKKFLGIF